MFQLISEIRKSLHQDSFKSAVFVQSLNAAKMYDEYSNLPYSKGSYELYKISFQENGVQM